MRLVAALAAAAILFLLPGAASAAEPPEAVYAKFHRAVMGKDIDEMLKYGPAARRQEMARLPASHREAALRMVSTMMPRAYTLVSKTVHRDGRSARLIATGPGELRPGMPASMYGTISMVLETGEWKVDEASWSSDKPSGLPQPRAAAPAEKAAAKAAPKAVAPAPAQPLPRWGEAKQPCVYKPVMTEEDLARCR